MLSPKYALHTISWVTRHCTDLDRVYLIISCLSSWGRLPLLLANRLHRITNLQQAEKIEAFTERNVIHRFIILIVYVQIKKISQFCLSDVNFTPNWLEGRTIKYTNFPAKYMNSRSKLHWNIHVVLCQVSVTWNKRQGIGIPELHDHAERHSAFNTSSKWISLIFYFYVIFLVFFPLMWCLQVYWH